MRCPGISLPYFWHFFYIRTKAVLKDFCPYIVYDILSFSKMKYPNVNQWDSLAVLKDIWLDSYMLELLFLFLNENISQHEPMKLFLHTADVCYSEYISKYCIRDCHGDDFWKMQRYGNIRSLLQPCGMVNRWPPRYEMVILPFPRYGVMV